MMIEDRLTAIEFRNARVDGDKAWEVSGMRRAVIAIITYFTAAIFMAVNDFQHPWVSALVPVIGYLLSTLSLPWIKSRWLEKRN